MSWQGSFMGSQETRHLFQQADVLFRKGEYDEALSLLERLDKSYPNNHRLLYPMALCLQKLGREYEALSVCDRLAEEFQYKKCEPLRQHLRERMKPAGVPGLDADPATSDGSTIDMGGLDSFDILGESARRPAPPPLPMESSWSIGNGVAWVGGVLGGLIGLSLFTYVVAPEYVEWWSAIALDSSFEQPQPQIAWWRNFALGMVFGTLASTAGGYLGLKLINSLPHDSFWSDMIDVGVFSFFSMLLGNIWILWLLIMPIAIYKHYDLNLTSAFILFCLYSVFSLVAFAVLAALTVPGALILHAVFG